MNDKYKAATKANNPRKTNKQNGQDKTTASKTITMLY
jgi:hypothetical protein